MWTGVYKNKLIGQEITMKITQIAYQPLVKKRDRDKNEEVDWDAKFSLLT